MRRKLGMSGIEVSAVGISGSLFGGEFEFDGRNRILRMKRRNDQESINMIHAALDCGINFIDTADIYGTGHSERLIGEAVKGRRDKVILSTKFGFQYDEIAGEMYRDYGYSDSYIRQACEASLRRLQTDYLDHYQFHVGGMVPKEQLLSVIDSLEGLKFEGKIRSYGWCADQLELARWFADHSFCSGFMFNQNLLYETQGMAAMCEEKNIAAFSIAPLVIGGLGTSAIHGKVDSIRDILTSGGRSLIQGELAWIWANRSVAVPIPGVKSAEQAVEIARAMEFGPLGWVQMEEINRLLGNVELIYR